MRKFLYAALLISLSAGFVSCSDDNDDEPQNPVTENTSGNNANDDDDNAGNNNNGEDNDVSANPEVDEYGIAISQEVDLGLSVNWAGWNIGATKPEQSGGYYAWGETEVKRNYVWSTYKWCKGSEYTMTKYCIDSDCGTVDTKTVLDSEDDVAHVKWDNGWRMPTKQEFEELANYCTWEWITYKDVNGYKVTGKRLSNGNRNSIFLPAVGCRNGTSLYEAGGSGCYWSSTLNSSNNSYYAYVFSFHKSYHNVGLYLRYNGYSARPVKEK